MPTACDQESGRSRSAAVFQAGEGFQDEFGADLALNDHINRTFVLEHGVGPKQEITKIVFENVGEIDVICAPSLTGNPTVRAEVRGRDVLLETPGEIIAKKVYYRGGAMQPRDMFDIACVVKNSRRGVPQ